MVDRAHAGISQENPSMPVLNDTRLSLVSKACARPALRELTDALNVVFPSLLGRRFPLVFLAVCPAPFFGPKEKGTYHIMG